MRTCWLLLLLLAVSQTWGQKAPDFDQEAAGFAAELGTNRLVKDAKDTKGMALVQMALAIDPDNERAHLTLGLREHGRELKPIATRITEEKFVKGILRRADSLREQADKDRALGERALLYYVVVNILDPENEAASRGQIQLGKLGIKGDPKDLLGTKTKPAEAPAEALPGAYANVQAPKDWLSFAITRDKLSLKEQTELITRKYAEICPREKYKAKTGLELQGSEPVVTAATGSETRIFTAEVDGRATLDKLWPWFGVPLAELSLVNVRGSQLDLKPLALSKLHILRLSRCEDLQRLVGLDQVPLTTLELSRCPSFADLGQLQGTKLESLVIFDCPKIVKLDGLGALPLQRLELSNCPKIRDLSELRKLPLESIHFISCPALSSLKAIEGLPVAEIEIRDCAGLRERDLVDSLKRMTKLTRITGLDERLIKQVLRD